MSFKPSILYKCNMSKQIQIKDFKAKVKLNVVYNGETCIERKHNWQLIWMEYNYGHLIHGWSQIYIYIYIYIFCSSLWV
jgi:hypothetical protein